MKRGTLIVILAVAVVLYLLFRAKKAAAQAATGAAVGTAAATRAPTTAETVTGGVLGISSLVASMLKSGSPSSVNVKSPAWSFDYGGSSDWSSLAVSPDFTTGEFSGTGAMTNTTTPDYSSGAFSGSGGWG
jgi:hypothetical protein